MINTHDRILAALNWEEPDRVPLTTYDWLLPRGNTERLLREAGVGLISRLPAHRVEHRQVEVITGDVSVKEAREIWPDKALWINFTSLVHIESPESIEAHTRELLQEAGTKKGFAIGITEDGPVKALEQSLAVISRVIDEHK